MPFQYEFTPMSPVEIDDLLARDERDTYIGRNTYKRFVTEFLVSQIPGCRVMDSFPGYAPSRIYSGLKMYLGRNNDLVRLHVRDDVVFMVNQTVYEEEVDADAPV